MNRMDRNSEGYKDPTAGTAYENIRKEERKKEAERTAAISALIPIMKQVAALAGFDITERIVLRDRETGKIYK